MISEALEYVRREMRIHLRVTDGEVQINSARILNENAAQGALITLINLEEEAVLRNTKHVVEVGGRVHYREPPVFMNLYLLFSFDFVDYGASLLSLSQTVQMFQDRRYMSPENADRTLAFPTGIERLIFEHHNMSFEAMNNLWSIMGGTHHPFVTYKMRMVKLQHVRPPSPGDEITRIAVDTVLG